MSGNRVLYHKGLRYILTEDPKVALERKQRRGYSKGYEDGCAYRIWNPPVSSTSPLPTINYQKLGKLYDVESYKKGFSEGYYQS